MAEKFITTYYVFTEREVKDALLEYLFKNGEKQSIIYCSLIREDDTSNVGYKYKLRIDQPSSKI